MSTGVDSDKAARALYALLELSKALSSVVDLDQLRKVVAEKAPAVVDAERITLSFHEPSGGKSTPVIDSKGNTIAILECTCQSLDEHDESLLRALAAHVAASLERMQVTEVHLENAAFEESLRLASEIQMRMLPPGTVDLPARTRFAIRAHIRPAKQVGGDLYDFFWTDDRLYFCIGDVTGKGIGSALVMAMTKTLFRAHAAFHDDPAKVMSAASARLYEETDPAMFVTAFCGFLDLRNGHLRYSNAGHDRPLILSAGRRVRPFLSKAGLPLGVLPKFDYVAEEKILNEGEALFLYTDGVTEATNGAEEMYKMDR